MSAASPLAVVTGGGGPGIGSAVVHRLARDGWQVAVTDRNEGRARAVASHVPGEHDGACPSFRLDVSDPDEVEAVMGRIEHELGPIDGLVNNAGWTRRERLTDTSLDTWRRVMAVNLDGTFLCARAVLPRMVERGRGAVVNVASISAWNHHNNGGAAYAAAKAGVTALTRVAATEVASHGVRVNAVAPGLVVSDAVRTMLTPDELTELESQIPLGRGGRPHEIAALIAFLLGDDAGFVTGEVYGISGGTLPKT